MDKIARPIDICSINRRDFWVKEQFRKLYSPIATYEDFSQVFSLTHRLFFQAIIIAQRKDLDDCLFAEFCCLQLKVFL